MPDPREMGETVSIVIPLAEKGDLREISIPSEPSETLHDVTLSARAEIHEDETLVTLAVESESRVWDRRHFRPNFMMSNRNIQGNVIYTLKDDRGNEYSYRPEDSSYYDYTDVTGAHVFLLSFEAVKPDAKNLVLEVPSLLSSEREETSYSLDLPGLKRSGEEFIPLNDQVTIGTQEFEVTGLERVEDGVKVHLDMGPKEEEVLISLKHYGLENIRTTNTAEWDNGRLDALEFNFVDKEFEELAEEEVIMKVERAIVETPGPWELTIPLERSR